jgi:putative exosortase-associated protein (TIGR04073 family)
LKSTDRRRTRHPVSPCSCRLQVGPVLTVLVLVFLLITPGLAAARDSAARKVGRGAANLTLGVLALPGEIVQTTRDSGPFVGATWGLVKGVAMTVATEVVGLWEVLTCPFETPPGFKPILKPEYPWGYFFEGRNRGRLPRER